MKSNLKFDFTVNKENNTVNVSREFAANLELVWEAWTTPEILDKWWAPKPYRTETKSMDFREGGMWLYAMISPENVKHWCKNDYHKIVHQSMFSGLDAFCDEKGEVNKSMPRTFWTNTFNEQGETTTVNIVAQYDSLADLEKVIKMGFKEGFTMALENLDQYIESQFKLRQQNKTSTKARVSSYLNFDGKTEEAFLFYKQVFKTEFLGKGIERFGDIPEEPGNPPVAEGIKKMVLHVELPILGGHILMGTDAPKEMGFTLSKGNNMHLCLEPETREEADRLFNELSAGGNVTMPMADMFFGAYFGEFSDQYGINWMINYQNPA
ncbi:SRPBCC domain-containing protein [uncultured Algoriphagus sp.]|uniref:SRPBCC domain-containing protein n=1 Tax=uncultured Algoriphagus sp. TaxID=417365 RepID=UPI0030EF783A|tara:strand:- start:3403 stop:4371 length:969 start_codon:yes stop_codon:yes gene_type:complete